MLHVFVLGHQAAIVLYFNRSMINKFTDRCLSAVSRIIRTLPALALLCVSGVAFAEISDGEIRVGLLVDMKSTYAHITGQGSVVAAQMAIEDAGGSINGKPIRLLHEDHANSADKVARVARDWLYEMGVDVIADVASSPLALVVQEINRPRGAVVFYNGVMTTAITGEKCAPTGIHWMYDGHAYNTVIGGELTRSGSKSWYFVTVDNAFGANVRDFACGNHSQQWWRGSRWRSAHAGGAGSVCQVASGLGVGRAGNCAGQCRAGHDSLGS
jgi:ABC-type branched-subunit amino acid transport system substrate-binding protein